MLLLSLELHFSEILLANRLTHAWIKYFCVFCYGSCLFIYFLTVLYTPTSDWTATSESRVNMCSIHFYFLKHSVLCEVSRFLLHMRVASELYVALSGVWWKLHFNISIVIIMTTMLTKQTKLDLNKKNLNWAFLYPYCMLYYILVCLFFVFF